MKSKKRFLSLCVSAVGVSLLFFGPAIIGNAEEGGAVQTNGAVTFYDEQTTPSSSTEPSTSASTDVSTISEPAQSSDIINKPSGKYPSTGELVKASVGITGGILLLAAFVLFCLKRKKDRETTTGKGA